MNNKNIGRVIASEKTPTTCDFVSFWIKSEEIVRPFDIVKIEHLSGSHSYAQIEELKYISDSASALSNYVSSDFGDINSEPFNQRLGTTIAEAKILHNDKNIEMPIVDGSNVMWSDEAGIQEALGLANLKNPIPAGFIQFSNNLEVPIEFESDYLIGPEGAHMNISGISGLATKTSYAMFLLSSIQQKSAKTNEKVTTVIFNVKGNDLLAIDEEPTQLDDKTKRDWEKCGLDAKPFENVTYLYPFAANDSNTSSHAHPDVLKRQVENKNAYFYYYDYDLAKEKLALLFSDIDDPNTTMESCVNHIQNELEGIDDWNNFKSQIRQFTKAGEQSGGDIQKASWRKFSRLIKDRTETPLFSQKRQTGNIPQKTIHDVIKDANPGDVLVVDIEPLPDYLQCFVFGDVVQTILGAKLGDEEDINGEDLGNVLVFADELNKYAPKGSGSKRTLTQKILEISERGRSLGMILFGAEQFRSGVHERVLGNCSTSVFGRTSPVEIEKGKDYSYLPKSYKNTIPRLPKGTLLLQHPVFKTSCLKVAFPFPAYKQPKDL